MRDIDELDRLHAAALPGEWVHDERDMWGCVQARASASGILLTVSRAAGGDADQKATCAFIVALHNAWPEVSARLRAAEAALARINEIRNSIIGAQTVNWSEHVYPLVAALDEAGYPGESYETARANVGTLLARATAAEAEVERLRAALRGLVHAVDVEVFISDPGPSLDLALTKARAALGEP